MNSVDRKDKSSNELGVEIGKVTPELVKEFITQAKAEGIIPNTLELSDLEIKRYITDSHKRLGSTVVSRTDLYNNVCEYFSFFERAYRPRFSLSITSNELPFESSESVVDNNLPIIRLRKDITDFAPQSIYLTPDPDITPTSLVRRWRESKFWKERDQLSGEYQKYLRMNETDTSRTFRIGGRKISWNDLEQKGIVDVFRRTMLAYQAANPPKDITAEIFYSQVLDQIISRLDKKSSVPQATLLDALDRLDSILSNQGF